MKPPPPQPEEPCPPDVEREAIMCESNPGWTPQRARSRMLYWKQWAIEYEKNRQQSLF